MKANKVTKKELIKIVNSLDEALYNATIERFIETTSKTSKDFTSSSIQQVEKSSKDSQPLIKKSHKHFDTDKPILSSVQKSISDFVKEHSFTPFVRCELRDISKKHGKMSSFTEHINKDTKLILINTGTFKYKSLRNNELLLSLHFAECIFREILYSKYKIVDIDRLDSAMDNFYESYYESLSNHKWN